MASTTLAGTPAPVESPTFEGTLGTEVVKLIVGPKRKEFTVHKKLVCDLCDYFRKAFCGPFKEAGEGIIYLADDSADAVGLFVEWLYRGKIKFRRTHAHFNTLIKLYLLTEKWCLYDLGNTVTDDIMNFFWEDTLSGSCYLYPDVVNHIWNETEEKSPLRRLCIERLVWLYWDDAKVNITPGKDRLSQIWNICRNHRSFFCEFFAYYQNFDRSATPPNPGQPSVSASCYDLKWARANCEFHRHNEGETCKKLKEAAGDQTQSSETQSSKEQSHDFFAELTQIKNMKDDA
ncbi:hypothetical protein BELL_0476g00020 [Botrytis elliptica]|uniref:BTB domain-containing protein n=1 Tax=Botrytis elliptica TaxID=278938 RepID=A0A4Z1JF54_9HELO|nr:hypothetical protein EAE99_007154 [Botrytis elliptica]TGO72238.1 hypothetical protein BELL_0476g00020 [Botrytis elliptica]